MGKLHDKSYPGESGEYLEARDKLLEAEMELRQKAEEVAEMRRGLPTGGAIDQDYEFEECGSGAKLKMSELFADGKDSLIIYSLMYGTDAEKACPACTSLLDSLNGISPHVTDQTNFAVVAKSPADKIQAWADGRGWSNLRLLSSSENSFNEDYFAEDDEGNQWPCINVFTKSDGGVNHYWGAELFFAPGLDGMHPRHADPIWPLWNMFDLTPEGRPMEWFPKYSYE